MKRALMAASLATVICANAQADTLLGLYIGGHIWANQAEGSFGEGATEQATFNFDDENQGSYFVALEHPIPLIPNIKISATTLDTVGSANIETSFIINGETFEADSELATTFDTSYVDYTLYYEIFDNDLLTFDLGLTARELESKIGVIEQSTLQESDLNVSAILPMLYVNTVIGLPFTGLNVFAQANFISYDDNSLYDYQLGLGYAVVDNLAVDLELTLGYRAVQLKLNDIDNLYSDLSFNGVFAGAIVHF